MPVPTNHKLTDFFSRPNSSSAPKLNEKQTQTSNLTDNSVKAPTSVAGVVKPLSAAKGAARDSGPNKVPKTRRNPSLAPSAPSTDRTVPPASKASALDGVVITSPQVTRKIPVSNASAAQDLFEAYPLSTPPLKHKAISPPPGPASPAKRRKTSPIDDDEEIPSSQADESEFELPPDGYTHDLDVMDIDPAPTTPVPLRRKTSSSSLTMTDASDAAMDDLKQPDTPGTPPSIYKPSAAPSPSKGTASLIERLKADAKARAQQATSSDDELEGPPRAGAGLKFTEVEDSSDAEETDGDDLLMMPILSINKTKGNTELYVVSFLPSPPISCTNTHWTEAERCRCRELLRSIHS